MSHCAMRMCSSNCQGVCGAPSGLMPLSSRGKCLTELSRSTCASALISKLIKCWRRGSGDFMTSGWMIAKQKRNHFLADRRLPVKNIKWTSTVRKPALIACLFVVHAGLTAAQAQRQTDQQPPTLRTQSNVVLVPTLVKDRAGKLVFGLQASDFMIEDNGVAQQVSMDEAEPQKAVSLVVAIQTGRSAVYEFNRMKGLATLLDQIA